MTRSPYDLLRHVLKQYADDTKWIDQPFENIRRIPNTKVGDVGQDFVECLCRELGIACEFPTKPDGTRLRQSSWDVKIQGKTFELKTASEDVKGAFQFNHIRYHREYEALLCIGVAPARIFMEAWSKADVATGKAGTLATMEKGANASYKLTKRPNQMQPIEEFKNRILLLTSDAS